MNAQEYISSGILEAYVTGCATPAERADIEAMAAKYPEIKAELDAIQDAVDAYTLRHSVEPPKYMQDKILDEIAATPRASADGDNTKVFRMEPAEKKGMRFTSILAIAASIVFLISLPIDIYLYNKVSADENMLTALNSRDQKLENDLKDSMLAYQAMRNEHYVLHDPMFKMITLTGMKAAPGAKAMVCWCPDSKELYFEPQKLPAAPKGMQYQLWAMIDGKPVDAGMIKMDSGLQKMKLIGGATAFAVTLEKEGGSDIPHGDMYVMGNI